jgi:hypothetical protein
MTRDCTPPKTGAKIGRKPGSKLLEAKVGAAKTGAATVHKATARLNHEIRHERPMTDWGQGRGAKGAKR